MINIDTTYVCIKKSMNSSYSSILRALSEIVMVDSEKMFLYQPQFPTQKLAKTLFYIPFAWTDLSVICGYTTMKTMISVAFYMCKLLRKIYL